MGDDEATARERIEAIQAACDEEQRRSWVTMFAAIGALTVFVALGGSLYPPGVLALTGLAALVVAKVNRDEQRAADKRIQEIRESEAPEDRRD